MNCAQRSGWIAATTLLVAMLGCSKTGEPTAATSASTDDASATATAAAANSAQSPSGVVPASASRPVVQADPIVVMHTSVGDVYVRLYEKQAPQSVANFLGYVRGRFYDGTVFHQVLPDFIALGGSFDQRMQPKLGRYAIANEAKNGLKNVRGSIAMTHDPADPHSAKNSFFFNLADNAKLDHRGSTPEEFGYCVFGQIIDGLETLDKLESAGNGKVVVNSVQLVMMPRDDQVQAAGFQSSASGSTR